MRSLNVVDASNADLRVEAALLDLVSVSWMAASVWSWIAWGASISEWRPLRDGHRLYVPERPGRGSLTPRAARRRYQNTRLRAALVTHRRSSPGPSTRTTWPGDRLPMDLT